MIITTDTYDAYPLQIHNPNAATVLKVSRLLSTCIAHESFFTDYTKACSNVCGTCPRCLQAKRVVASSILDPRAITWEVWRKNPETGELLDFVGILRLSRVRLGCDATAHYFFFDGKLSDKTELLDAWKQWAFTDQPDWKGLHRVNLEIPVFAFALAKHAHQKLGFGGPFSYSYKGLDLPVEGVRHDAILWRGDWHDELIMGLTNGI